MSRFLLTTIAAAFCAVACAAPTQKNPVVVLETSMGNIKIELFADKAPITVKNFIDYVDSKHYDGTIFHRVMGKENSGKDFMIQGGGFQPGLVEKQTKAPIKNEAGNGVKNERGTIAMARTDDPDSATSQFFINVADNSFLNRAGGNPGYAAFGKVIEGMDVVDKIKAVPTQNLGRGKENTPTTDIVS